MIVTIASQKGGVGKTTLTTALAGALLTTKRSVCIVDADPQRSATEWAEDAAEDPRLRRIALLEHAQPDLHKRDLSALADIVLVDCPGAIDALLRSAVRAADRLIVPLRASHLDARSLRRLVQLLDSVQRERPKPLPIRLVLNQVRLSPKLERRAAELQAGLPENYGIFRTRVRQLTDFDDAFGLGKTPLELRSSGEAAADLRALAAEVWEWVN